MNVYYLFVVVPKSHFKQTIRGDFILDECQMAAKMLLWKISFIAI